MASINLAGVLLVAVGALVGLMIFYWTIRLAVRHGIEDARRRRGQAPPDSGYWDPARLGGTSERR